MKGFKIFNPDFSCNPGGNRMVYAENQRFTLPGDRAPKLCSWGIHFCPRPADVFNYYNFDPNNIVCEVEALGPVDGPGDGDKVCTVDIQVGRRLTWHEVLNLVNTGAGCTGLKNSGDWNSGNRNSGNRNSGDLNSGDWNSGNRNSGNRNSGDLNSGNRNSGDLNSGDWNSGNRNSGDWNSGNRNSGDLNSGDLNSGNRNSGDLNSGDWNSGNRNSGDWNSGNRNSGDLNSGDRNSGDWNSGDRNSGDWNSGNRNSGDLNSGDWNSGNRNSGDWNSGNRNSGDLNSGDRNSGDWNSGDRNSGVFCTDAAPLLLFNKPCDWSRDQWRDSEAAYLMREVLITEWRSWSMMTDEEKAQFPRAETAEGYLKRHDYKAAHATWWAKLDARQRALFPALPNFDKAVFESITGISIDAKP